MMTSNVMLLLLFSVALAAAASHPDQDTGCRKCNVEECPKEAAMCPFGMVNDVCGCCPGGVCGLPEGDKCYNASVLPASARRFGLCGDNLACLLRHDLTDKDDPEAICVCKETQPVCGSDNRTYSSVCQLTHRAAQAGVAKGLYLKQWGPCLAAPWITSGPAETRSNLHSALALDCEVKGYPPPTVHWEFKGDDGIFKILPSDDLYMAVQVRGGPEPYMATSWMQIVDVRHTDSGLYTCVATNSEGEARATAGVGVRG